LTKTINNISSSNNDIDSNKSSKNKLMNTISKHLFIFIVILLTGCSTSYYFQEAKSKDTIIAYQNFQKQYPNSPYEKIINEKIDSLKMVNDFNKAIRMDDEYEYDRFLSHYSQERFIPWIKKIKNKKIKLIENEFEQVEKKNTLHSYRYFMNTHKQGLPIDIANKVKSNISKLEKELDEFVDKNISIHYSGLRANYKHLFNNKLGFLAQHIIDANIDKTILPFKIFIEYNNGSGQIQLIINQNTNNKEVIKYGRLNIAPGVATTYIDLRYSNLLLSILGEFLFSVARDANFSSEIYNFDLSIRVVKNNGDWFQSYAHILDYDVLFYKNVFLNYDNELYEITTENPQSLNNMYWFVLGKPFGLDGKPSRFYYAYKFFKIPVN